MLPILLSIASATPAQAGATPHPTAAATAPAQRPSLLDLVAQKMSPLGRPIFERYVAQQLVPQLRADRQAEVRYLQQLHALVATPALDLDATTQLIEARKKAADATATTIRTSAFAMLRVLPAIDRKLGLTAIFTDARLPAPSQSTSPQPAR